MKKNAFKLFLLLCLVATSSHARPIKQKYYFVQEDDGPEPPPSVFIDKFTGALLLAGVSIAYFSFTARQRNFSKSLHFQEAKRQKIKIESPSNP